MTSFIWLKRPLQSAGAVMLAASMACGGTQAGHGTVYDGDASARPSMECLPTFGDEGRRGLSEKMRFALTLADEAFDFPGPHPPPSGAALAELQQWSESDLRQWLEQKSQMVQAAREELDSASDEAHDQRVYAGAIVGLMYEDVARVLMDVPTPRELSDEPEIAEMYQDVVRSQAEPYLVHSRNAYRACRLNGEGREGLGPWSRFCGERGGALPAASEVDVTGAVQLESGESATSVEVIRE